MRLSDAEWFVLHDDAATKSVFWLGSLWLRPIYCIDTSIDRLLLHYYYNLPEPDAVNSTPAQLSASLLSSGLMHRGYPPAWEYPRSTASEDNRQRRLDLQRTNFHWERKKTHISIKSPSVTATHLIYISLIIFYWEENPPFRIFSLCRVKQTELSYWTGLQEQDRKPHTAD